MRAASRLAIWLAACSAATAAACSAALAPGCSAAGFGRGGETINNIYETGPGGADLHEMDRIQDQQQDALDDADAQQDAYQDASDDSDFGSSFDGGGGQDV